MKLVMFTALTVILSASAGQCQEHKETKDAPDEVRQKLSDLAGRMIKDKEVLIRKPAFDIDNKTKTVLFTAADVGGAESTLPRGKADRTPADYVFMRCLLELVTYKENLPKGLPKESALKLTKAIDQKLNAAAAGYIKARNRPLKTDEALEISEELSLIPIVRKAYEDNGFTFMPVAGDRWFTVTLVPDPRKASVYLMSVFEYRMKEIRAGREEAEKELERRIVTVRGKLNMAGKYYYKLGIDDRLGAKKTLTIDSDGEHVLK